VPRRGLPNFVSMRHDEHYVEALAASGFTSIKTTGWEWGACSDSDSTCTGAVATGPTGQRVKVAVGCGFWFKGCTVRILGAAR